MLKPYSKAEAIRHLKKHGLYIMKPNDINRFVSCGVKAFDGYELYNYFFNGKDYIKKITLTLEMVIKATGEKGLIYADSEEVNGFAQWVPPGFSGNSLWDYIQSGLWKYLFMSDFIGSIQRMDHTDRYAFKKKTEITQNQDVFLYNLAVEPSMRGKGIAKKLLHPMLEYASSINRPCYLETYDTTNITIYKRIGYQKLPDTKVPGTFLTHYPFIYKIF